MLERAVTRIHVPADCALLIAIPLRESEFYDDCEVASGKEYARIFRAQLSALPIEQVWEKYERVVARPVTEAVGAARARGVLTHTRASVGVWRNVVEERSVVSLVAHWKAAGFTSDVIGATPNLLNDLADATGPAGRAMQLAVTAYGGVSSGATAHVLNDCLRAALLESNESRSVMVVANDPEQCLDRNWTHVMAEFPHWRLQESGMELADVRASATSMATAFRQEYTGTQDLRMCHSVMLGEAIKRAAPRSRVVMNQRPVRPLAQLALYGGILELLATGRYDFAAAALALHSAVMRRAR
jgi:hypothetical protein